MKPRISFIGFEEGGLFYECMLVNGYARIVVSDKSQKEAFKKLLERMGK